MGLDACVYCNCYETGKVRTPPPQPELVFVDFDTGQVSFHWDAQGADERRFDEWLASAGEYGPRGKLVGHRIGNIVLVGFLRDLFARTPEKFPTLPTKVVHNGTHGGDFLTCSDVEMLALEIESVRNLHCPDSDDELSLRTFETQVAELIRGSRSVGKPIVF